MITYAQKKSAMIAQRELQKVWRRLYAISKTDASINEALGTLESAQSRLDKFVAGQLNFRP